MVRFPPLTPRQLETLLAALRAHLPGTPADLLPCPEIMAHQLPPEYTWADCLWALHRSQTLPATALLATLTGVMPTVLPLPTMRPRIARSEARGPRIRLLAHTSPFHPGGEAHRRYALYRDGLPVADFLRAGGTQTSLHRDERRGIVRVEAA